MAGKRTDSDTVKTTVELPGDLWRAAKIRAMDERSDFGRSSFAPSNISSRAAPRRCPARDRRIDDPARARRSRRLVARLAPVALERTRPSLVRFALMIATAVLLVDAS